MYTQIGVCPKCGAPIYTYSVWNAITPPPSIPSCGCNPQEYTTYTTTDLRVEPPKDSGHSSLTEIEKRIIAKYRGRYNGIPRHTMGVIYCPDCKIPLGLHSYHCDCCGWHDSEKEAEVMKTWDKTRGSMAIYGGVTCEHCGHTPEPLKGSNFVKEETL